MSTSQDRTLINQMLGIGMTEAKPELNEIERLQLIRYVFNPSSDIKLDDRITEATSFVKDDKNQDVLKRGRFLPIKDKYRPALVGGISDLNPPQMKKLPIYAGYIARGLENSYAYLGVKNIEEWAGIRVELAADLQFIICPEIPADNPTWLQMMSQADTFVKEAEKQIKEWGAKYEVENLFDKTRSAAAQMLDGLQINLEYVHDYTGRSIAELHEGRAGRPGKTVLDARDLAYFALLGVEVPQEYLTFDPKNNAASQANIVSAAVAEAMQGSQAGQQAMAQAILALAESIKGQQAAAPTAQPQEQPKTTNNPNPQQNRRP